MAVARSREEARTGRSRQCRLLRTAALLHHSSILPLMALNSLYCADVPLSNYSLTLRA